MNLKTQKKTSCQKKMWLDKNIEQGEKGQTKKSQTRHILLIF